MSFFGILAGALSLLAGVWARFDREFGFAASIAADGVHISRGLTAQRQVTIPPGRIHAIEVTQPLIWRIFDWYRVEITQAGNAAHTKDEKNKGMQVDVASDVLLPVGSRTEVLHAIAIAIPDLGVDDATSFIESLRVGTREDRWMTPIPRSARILDPPGVQPPRLRPDRRGIRDPRWVLQPALLDHPAHAHPVRVRAPGAGPALARRGLRPSRTRPGSGRLHG